MSVEEPDWSILITPGVDEVVQRVSQQVANAWADAVELDDVLQEAYVILATKHVEARQEIEKGGLSRWLWCDLTDFARAQRSRTRLNVSYEALFR